MIKHIWLCLALRCTVCVCQRWESVCIYTFLSFTNDVLHQAWAGTHTHMQLYRHKYWSPKVLQSVINSYQKPFLSCAQYALQQKHKSVRPVTDISCRIEGRSLRLTWRKLDLSWRRRINLWVKSQMTPETPSGHIIVLTFYLLLFI